MAGPRLRGSSLWFASANGGRLAFLRGLLAVWIAVESLWRCSNEALPLSSHVPIAHRRRAVHLARAPVLPLLYVHPAGACPSMESAVLRGVGAPVSAKLAGNPAFCWIILRSRSSSGGHTPSLYQFGSAPCSGNVEHASFLGRPLLFWWPARLSIAVATNGPRWVVPSVLISSATLPMPTRCPCSAFPIASSTRRTSRPRHFHVSVLDPGLARAPSCGSA